MKSLLVYQIDSDLLQQVSLFAKSNKNKKQISKELKMDISVFAKTLQIQFLNSFWVVAYEPKGHNGSSMVY